MVYGWLKLVAQLNNARITLAINKNIVSKNQTIIIIIYFFHLG